MRSAGVRYRHHDIGLDGRFLRELLPDSPSDLVDELALYCRIGSCDVHPLEHAVSSALGETCLDRLDLTRKHLDYLTGLNIPDELSTKSVEYHALRCCGVAGLRPADAQRPDAERIADG